MGCLRGSGEIMDHARSHLLGQEICVSACATVSSAPYKNLHILLEANCPCLSLSCLALLCPLRDSVCRPLPAGIKAEHCCFARGHFDSICTELIADQFASTATKALLTRALKKRSVNPRYYFFFLFSYINSINCDCL